MNLARTLLLLRFQQLPQYNTLFLIRTTLTWAPFHIQVERALTFWCDGHVTLDGIGQGSKSCIIRKSINLNTGKEKKTTEFNQAIWGAVTNGYLNSIKTNIARGKFNWVGFVKAASKFKKPSCHGESSFSAPTATGHTNVQDLSNSLIHCQCLIYVSFA